jgi:hypothetical protein
MVLYVKQRIHAESMQSCEQLKLVVNVYAGGAGR